MFGSEASPSPSPLCLARLLRSWAVVRSTKETPLLTVNGSPRVLKQLVYLTRSSGGGALVKFLLLSFFLHVLLERFILHSFVFQIRKGKEVNYKLCQF